jgi:enoyl-CoA hydratase/carnithine racemase
MMVSVISRKTGCDRSRTRGSGIVVSSQSTSHPSGAAAEGVHPMSAENNPVISHKRGQSLHLTLNRPAKKNAISNAMLDVLDEALVKAQRDDTVRSVVLTGAGAVFSSGRDIKEFTRPSNLHDQSLDNDQEAFATVITRLSDMSKPTIAAVRGYAFGGAQALSLACDFVVAEHSAKFGNVEMAFGFPAAMNTVLLARHVGRRMGLEIAMTGEPYTAQRFFELGLVNRLAADGELDSAVEGFADLLNSRAPWAVARTKSTFRAAEEMTLNGAIHTGTQLNQLLMLSSQTTPVHSDSNAHTSKTQTTNDKPGTK